MRTFITLGAIAVVAAAMALFVALPPQSDLQLGPADGLDLPAVDLDRVVVGVEAPDFTLRSLSGEIVTLSDFRGRKNVVLVFYRGHW